MNKHSKIFTEGKEFKQRWLLEKLVANGFLVAKLAKEMNVPRQSIYTVFGTRNKKTIIDKAIQLGYLKADYGWLKYERIK